MMDYPANGNICLWCNNAATGSHGGCYHHDPDYEELRTARASKAAQSKGNAELRKLKAEVRDVIAELKSGALDRTVGTAMLQGYRVMRDLIELERRIKETDELAADIAAIKEHVESDY